MRCAVGLLVAALGCWLTPGTDAAVVSRYSFEGGLKDSTGRNHLSGRYTEAAEGVCGAGHVLEGLTFLSNRNPVGVPLGNEAWTMAGYVKALVPARRTVLHIGGDGGALKGAGLEVDKNGNLRFIDYSSDGRVAFVQLQVGRYYHLMLTYDGKQAAVYVDGLLVFTHQVRLELVAKDRYGGLSIGERHLGGTRISRFGRYVVDEVVVATGVLSYDEVTAPCKPFAAFSFDNHDAVDDTVCGPAAVLPPGKGFQPSASSPPLTGAWTMSVWVKPVTRGARSLMHMGGSSGAGLAVAHDLRLWLRYAGQKVQVPEFLLQQDTWHQLVLRYDTFFLRVYAGGALVLQQAAEGLKLQAGSVSIGGGDSSSNIMGEYVFDEAVFGHGVMGFSTLRPRCRVITRYSFDSGVYDTEGNNHLDGSYTPDTAGGVCRAAQRIMPGKTLVSRNPTRMAVGQEPWTMALYFKAEEAGARELLSAGDVGLVVSADQELLVAVGGRSNPGTGVVVAPGRWYHVAATYDTQVVTVFVEGVVVLSHAVPLSLSRSQLSVGGSPDTPSGLKLGRYLVDEVMFGYGVLSLRELRTSCGEVSRFGFESGLLDTVGSNTPSTPGSGGGGEGAVVDGVCGKGYRLTPGAYHLKKGATMLPLGGQPWTMSVFAKIVVPGRRVLMHMGSGSSIRAGVALGVTEDMRLWVQDNWRMPAVPDVTLQQGRWYHLVATYDGERVRVYVDGEPMYSYEVQLLLAGWGDECGLSIGGTSTGNATDGEYEVDEAMFGSTVLGLEELGIPCAAFSKFSFDGDLRDRGQAGNDLGGAIATVEDSICGTAHRLVPNGGVHGRREPNLVPLGDQPWTMSLFVKVVTPGKRVLMHLGADSGRKAGFSFGLESDLRVFVHDYERTHRAPDATLQTGQWYHIGVTYDSVEAKLYLDGKEVFSYAVELELLQGSKYGGLSIGERHLGGTRIARGGEYIVDEAVFGRGVISMEELRQPCRPVSFFTFEEGLQDQAGSNHLFGTYAPESSDGAYGVAQRLLPNQLHGNRSPAQVPLGRDSWTLSVYAKVVTPGTRVLMHLGGDEANTRAGFGFGITKDLEVFVHDYGSNPRTGHTVAPMKWHHFVVTYDAFTVRVYVDEALVYSYDVELSLVAKSRYGGLSVGERHMGGTHVARGGEYLVDEVLFGTGLIKFEKLRSKWSIYSRYSFDQGLKDEVGSNDLFGNYQPHGIDSVCGAAQLLEVRKLNGNRKPQGVPLGDEPWTVGLYVKAKELAKRVLIHIGSDDRSPPRQGVGLGVRGSDGTLEVIDYYRNPRTGFKLRAKQWYHLVMTYDSKTLRVYVDGERVLEYGVSLALVASSRYGGLSVGERHLGGSPFARGGVYVVDEAVFGKGLVPFGQLEATSCRIFSKYTMDNGVQDSGSSSNHLGGRYVQEQGDKVCGAAQRMQDRQMLGKRDPADVPLGNQPWTMALHVKQLVNRGNRVFLHIGSDDTARQGIGIGVTGNGDLRVTDYARNPSTGFKMQNNKWYHVAMTYDSKTVTVYVDGVSVYSYEQNLQLVRGSRYGGLSVGCRHLGGSPFARSGEYLFDEAVFGHGIVGFSTLTACNSKDVSFSPMLFTLTAVVRTHADGCKSVSAKLEVPTFEVSTKVAMSHQGECDDDDDDASLWTVTGGFPKAVVGGEEIQNVQLSLQRQRNGSWRGKLTGFVQAPGGSVQEASVEFTGTGVDSFQTEGPLSLGPVKASNSVLTVSGGGFHTGSAPNLEVLFANNVKLPPMQGLFAFESRSSIIKVQGKAPVLDMVSFELLDAELELTLEKNGANDYTSRGTLKGEVDFLNTTLSIAGTVTNNVLSVMTGTIASDNMRDAVVSGTVSLTPDTDKGCGLLEGEVTVQLAQLAGSRSFSTELRFDPCVQNVGDAVLVIEEPVAPLTPYPGVEVGSASATVMGEVYVDVNGEPTLTFTGVVAGRTVFMGKERTAEAMMEDGAITSVQVNVQHKSSFLKLEGGFVFTSEQCSSSNEGAMNLSIPSLSIDQEVGWMQEDGCDSRGRATFNATVTGLNTLSVHGIQVSDPTVTLRGGYGAQQQFRLQGNVTGEVALDAQNVVSVEMQFSEATGLGPVEGTILHVTLGAMQGNFSFTARREQRGVLAGTATLGMITGNAVIPPMEASVMYVYDPEEATSLPTSFAERTWLVEGRLDELKLHGLSMTDVVLTLTGTYVVDADASAAGEKTVVWGGEVVGKASFGGVETTVKANIERDSFSTLVGQVQVVSGGLDGGVTVSYDNDTACGNVEGTGSLKLISPPINVETSFTYDQCAILEGEQSFTVSGQLGASESVTILPGLDIASALVRARATVGADGKQSEWSGFMQGTVRVFDANLLATAVFESGVVQHTTVQLEVEKDAWNLRGSVTYAGEQCNSGNRGDVSFVMKPLGIAARGSISQQDGCGSGGRPLWSITASSDDDLDLYGVLVTDLQVTAEQREAEDGTKHWRVTVQGELQLGEAAGIDGSLSASVVWDSETGVLSFTATGAVLAGPLSVSSTLDVTPTEVTGSGTLDLATEEESGSLTGAEVNLVYATGSVDTDKPLWKISGTVKEMHVLEMQLQDGHVAFDGYARTDGKTGLTWNGTVGGTAVIADATLKLHAAFSQGAFDSLEGELSVDSGNVQFVGDVSIDADDGCAAIESSGVLSVESPSMALAATLMFDKCATAPGQTRFAVSGESSEPVAVGSLVLTSATVDFDSRVSPSGKAEWSGNVTANTNMFGATSTASVGFEAGKVVGAYVHTTFRLPNGILQGTVGFNYDVTGEAGCSTASGYGNAVIDMKGRDPLSFSGAVEYQPCTGVLSIDAAYDGKWGALSEVKVSIASEGHGGNASKKLGDRQWAGSISAQTEAGFGVSISFDTSKDATGAEASLTYSDDNADVSVTYSKGDCKGTGSLVLKNLPHGIPSIETEVSFTKNNCQDDDEGKGWSLRAEVTNVEIPFFGNKLSLQEVSVQIDEDATGKKTVAVTGTFMKDYSLTLGFALPLKDVTLTGSGSPGATPDGFSSGFGGSSRSSSSSPFATGLGKGLPLFSDLKTVKLGSVSVTGSFSDKSLVVKGEASLHKLQVTVVVVVQRSPSKKWAFGVLVLADGPEGGEVPGVVGNVLKQLTPQYVQFSLATQAMELADGTELRKGLALRVALGSDNPLAQTVDAQSPGSLREQVKAAKDGSPGLVLVAQLVSAQEVTVFLQLAGNIPLSKSATLKEVALAFTVGFGLPEIGFMVGLEFTLGSGANAKVLTTKAFMGLSPAGLTLEALVDLEPPRWEKPFGVKGLAILFPLGLGITISPALLPTRFSMMGGLEVGGATGSLVMGVDLADFRKSAFRFEVENFDLQRILVDVAGCRACSRGVLGVLTDISFERFEASVSANPVSDTTITFVDHVETIAPGVTITLEGLDLWGVLKVTRAHFAVSASGMEVELVAEKMNWGPLVLSSATDPSKGPSFELVLRKDEQRLKIDGKATVLGQSVALYLMLSDAKKEGFFQLRFAGIQLDVTWVAQGVPGRRGFTNTITAELRADVFAKIIDSATAFLYDLRDKANAAFDKAQGKLRAAQNKLNNAKRHLENERRRLNGKFSSARNKVNGLNRSISRKKSECRKYQRQCKGWRIGKCFKVPGCWIAVGALELAKNVALGALYVAQGLMNAGISIAQGAVDVAKGAVSVAQGAVEVARVGVNAFAELGAAVLGVLKNILRIKYIRFSTALSSRSIAVDFEADLVVFGIPLKPRFSIELNFDALKQKIKDFFRNTLRGKFGKRIPGL